MWLLWKWLYSGHFIQTMNSQYTHAFLSAHVSKAEWYCKQVVLIFEEFLSQTYMPRELNYHIFSLLKHEIKPDLVSCPKLHTVAAADFEEMMDELELLQSFKSIYFKLFKFVQILLIFFSRRHTECWCASVSFICRTRLSVQVQMSAYLIFRWLTCLRELYR